MTTALVVALSSAAAATEYTFDDVTTTKGQNPVELPEIQNSDILMSDAWTLQFTATVTDAVNWPIMLTIGSSQTQHNFRFWTNNQGDYQAGFDTKGGQVTKTDGENITGFTFADGVERTYTITSTGTSTPMLTLYVDGEELVNATYSIGEQALNWKINRIIFGGEYNNNGKSMTATFSDISFREGAHAPGAIPEPTTASLSLLALAGLAARRRRK